MAVKKEITIVIGKDGKVVMETHGFKGAECDEALKPLEKAVGKTEKRTRTGEYYETKAQAVRNKNSSSK
jgi:hypothetical protein